MYNTINQYVIKNYTKIEAVWRLLKFDFGRNFPKICEIFRSRVLKNGKKTCFWGKKSVKKSEKRNFISLVINILQRKCRKSKKKFARVLEWIQKNLFLQSQTTTIRDGTREGVVNRGMFIERMEECSKYSRRGIWDSQAMRPGQTKNKRH